MLVNGNPALVARIRGLFDHAWYLSCYRDDIPAGMDAFDHFLSAGLARGCKPNATLDPLFYRALHPSLDGIALFADMLAHADSDVPVLTAGIALPAVAREKRVRPAACPVQKDREDFLRHPQLPPTSTAPFDCNGSSYHLVSPPAEDFLDRFRREEPFAIARISHGDWDGLALHRRYCKLVTDALGENHRWTQVQIETMAARLCEEYHNDDFGIFHENFIPELLHDLRNPVRDPRFFHAISFKGYPTVDERLFVWEQTPATASADRDLLEDAGRYFPPDELLLDATAWKRWLITGALQELPGLAQLRPVILVGQERLGSLAQRWQLPGFFHVQISSDAYPQRHALLGQCRDAIIAANELARVRGLGRPLCLLQGSSFAYWLMRRLFTRFPDVFYLDMGQALHAWFYDDPDIELLTWGSLFAPTIVRAGGMEAYYAGLGVQQPVLENLFAGRVPPEILKAARALPASR